MQSAQCNSPLAPSSVSVSASAGKVVLVGAGPGDPDLLTLKAHRALQDASCVLIDHLVSEEVLALIPINAQRIYVGKEHQHHSLSQLQIIDLMIKLARSGQSLVRLKGGDPYVFGRGGEEAQALARAGIAFEVIPGISAAQGMSAYAGIPLTHREHAAAVVFAAGHRQSELQDLDWAALARAHQTVVIYMGVSRLSHICKQLVSHGLRTDMPAAAIENATRPNQRVMCATLLTLPALALSQALKAPALIVVGTVVNLYGQLAPGRAEASAQLEPAELGPQCTAQS